MINSDYSQLMKIKNLKPLINNNGYGNSRTRRRTKK